MKSHLASIVGGCVISFAAMAYLLRKAPIGHQDDRGFHHGDPLPADEPLSQETVRVKSREEMAISLRATDQFAG